jgi:hypothetical protein
VVGPGGGSSAKVSYSEEEWLGILENSCNSMNLSAHATGSVEGEPAEQMIQIADGKIYSVEQVGDEYDYSYRSEIDGVYYVWRSTDNETWECYQVDSSPINGTYVFGMLDSLDFECAISDAEKGVIIFDQEMNGNALYAQVEIRDGRIVSYTLEMAGYSIVANITYGNASIGELPPVV